jgi:hypothetical protein
MNLVMSLVQNRDLTNQIMFNDNHNNEYVSIMDYLNANRNDYLNERQLRDLFNTYYLIGKQIGKGGFGTIFSGIRRKDSKPIAIKVIKKNKITQWHTNVSLSLSLSYTHAHTYMY